MTNISIMKLTSLVIVLIVFLLFNNNVMSEEATKMNLNNVPMEKWNSLSRKKIFFGHQSVGYNILDGVETLKESCPAIMLKVVKVNSPDQLDKHGKGILYHAEIGSNFNPISKIDDFAYWLDNGVGKQVDIAFLKLCFVDIGTTTDLESLFSHYKKTMLEIKKKYPSLTIVHCTVPLVSEKIGISRWKHLLKGVVKKVLGKDEFYENENKFLYNEMIRREYLGKEPVFDLAKVESTFPDGSRSLVFVGGKNIESLVPAYTNDGGHLTAEGKRNVAADLLVFLANLQ